MPHMSDGTNPVSVSRHEATSVSSLCELADAFGDVMVIFLPLSPDVVRATYHHNFNSVLRSLAANLGESATLIVVGAPVDLVHAHQEIGECAQYQLWVALRTAMSVQSESNTHLPQEHCGATVYTRYKGQLRHTKTRLAYTYCPACGKTTKDYGGKKHTYHSYGTLISDVWRDVTLAQDKDETEILTRLADLFGVSGYRELRAVFIGESVFAIAQAQQAHCFDTDSGYVRLDSALVNQDSLAYLRTLPSNSIDFAFADPPYNLRKVYGGYADDKDIQEYFSWCDEWITEMARTLRSGGTLALLNIPLWSIRHFLHLETLLQYRNWIVWDALSFPVRLIMPAHYSILCFTKGEPSPIQTPPKNAGGVEFGAHHERLLDAFYPLKEKYCLRASCVSRRNRNGIVDRAELTDIWSDIHRLKHNSRRVDHPCQVPADLMYRLITLFTQPGDLVLDCFNGAGTTTLAAHQMGRRYLGIEIDPKYHRMAVSRHSEVEIGIDPFRKMERDLTAKNSPVARLPKQKYEVSKKVLQLEVKRVALELGHLPNRHELEELGEYPIRYYDEYFISWGEVCAAARTTGMSELPNTDQGATYKQLQLLERRGGYSAKR